MTVRMIMILLYGAGVEPGRGELPICAENDHLRNVNYKLSSGNNQLKEKVKDYSLLRKVFGNKQIDSLLEQAQAAKQFKQRGTRFNNNNYER